MTTRTKDGDLRILGASDGYAHALVNLRASLIAPIAGAYAPGIHPRHVRKLAAREAKLKPLREFEQWLMRRHAEAKEAYERTCSDGVSANPKEE